MHAKASAQTEVITKFILENRAALNGRLLCRIVWQMRVITLTFIGFQHRAHVVDGKVDERADAQRQPALRGIDDVNRQLSGLPLG